MAGMSEEFNLWLTKAKESLDDAVASLSNHRYSLTAFCCQQSTEITKISKFYFLVRYPDLNKKFFATPKVAQTTLEKTKEIFSWIEKKLTE